MKIIQHETFAATKAGALDALGDRFESAWRAGQQPRIEEYLSQIEEGSRTTLVAELLRVELELRRARGETPTPDEYARRLPVHADRIAEVFQSGAVRAARAAETVDLPGDTGRSLAVRCPHCHAGVSLPTDSNLAHVACPDCGSQFGLVRDATDESSPLVSLGRFELVERVGMGAFGSVWKARDKELDRSVAVKVPRQAGMTAQEQEKFFREARAAAQLRHPNIVSLHEVGRDGDSIYIVSDFVEGVTLGDWMAGQKLTNREAAALCATIANALHHAHEQGVVHRDLKPANIMIDGEGQPHLMDFGLARREAGEVSVTLEGHILGTPAYMSPEQAEGRSHAADRRSDVYSLGVVLFQLLTGELPFRGNVRMVVHQVIHDEPPAPRKLNANVSKDLETITLKCLEKDPARRYQSAHEVAAELRRTLSGEPILARPIGRAARAWRWAKRKPAAAALLAVLAAVAVLGPVVAVYQVQQNRKLQSQVVRNLLERGSAARDEGKIADAVTLYAGAFAAARDGDPLRESARNLAAGWADHLCIGMPMIHEALVTFVDISPNGRTILTKTIDGTARLWDTATGKPIGEPMRQKGEKPGGGIVSAAFSPNGHIVVTDSNDMEGGGLVRAWDATSGRPLGEPMRRIDFNHVLVFSQNGRTILAGSQLLDVVARTPVGEPLQHDSNIFAAVFSPDGRTLITGSADNTARLWNSETGKPDGEPMKHDDFVNAVACSPDGNMIVTGSSDSTARLWDAATGKPLGEPLRCDGPIRAVAFSPDGRTVVAASEDRSARLWDVTTAKPLGEIMRHQESLSDVAFSPDGRMVVTASDDETAQLWDASSGKPIGPPMRHNGAVWTVVFSPDGHSVLTGGGDYTARLWNTAMGRAPRASIRHDESVAVVAFSPDGHSILTGGFDNTARLWNASTGQPVGEPMRHDDVVWYAAFSPNGRIVLTGSNDQTARLWDASTGEPIGEPLRHGDILQAAAFSPDGRMLLTASNDKTARLWETATQKPLGQPMRHESNVWFATFSPDGRSVLTGGHDCTARIWDAATGKPLTEPMRHNKEVLGCVRAAAFSPDGRNVITGSDDHTAQLWNAKTGEPLGEPLRHDDAVYDVAFSADGHKIATASKDNSVRVWDAASRELLGEPMTHDGAINAVAFSPDGRCIATASDDQTARLWDAETGKPLGEPLRHDDSVKSLAFSPDGRTLVTASFDHTARLWPLPHLLPDDPELVTTWAAVRTGMMLDNRGLVRTLTEDELLEAADLLEQRQANQKLP